MSKPAKTYRKVPLDQLTEDPQNARVHGDRNIEAIRKSLDRFGQVEPLVVRKGSNVVVGGNGRWENLTGKKAMLAPRPA